MRLLKSGTRRRGSFPPPKAFVRPFNLSGIEFMATALALSGTTKKPTLPSRWAEITSVRVPNSRLDYGHTPPAHDHATVRRGLRRSVRSEDADAVHRMVIASGLPPSYGPNQEPVNGNRTLVRDLL